MTPIESIFYMMWRGLAVGILISAPMGPVGILCIQRTLDRGRRAGFSTGIGAAISDLFYCLLTGFGLSFIEDFLQENSNVIQLFGSIVLIAFSIYLFKKNPSSPLRRPMPQNVSVKKNMLGGFLFTFSNPLIIFLIIGLFARFNFTSPEIQGGFYAVGYVFIIVGALLWWYGVTYLIDKVRAKFNMGSMKKMNIFIGIVILAFACVGIVSSIIGLTSTEAKADKSGIPALIAADINQVKPVSLLPGMAEIELMSTSENISEGTRGQIILFNAEAIDDNSDNDSVSSSTSLCGLPEGIDLKNINQWRLGFRLSDINSHPAKKYTWSDSGGHSHKVAAPGWNLVLDSHNGEEVKCMIHPVEYEVNPLSSQRALMLEISGPGDFLYKGVFRSGITADEGWNYFEIDYDDLRGLSIKAGNRGLSSSINLPELAGAVTGLSRVRLGANPGGKIKVAYPMLYLPTAPAAIRSELEMNEISERLRLSGDMLESEWQLLDYTLEESKLRLGGDYRVAIVKTSKGDYEIVYMGGAKVSRDIWQPGMVKGMLIPTGITGIYEAKWRDHQGHLVKTAIKSQLEGNILTFHFPELDSKIRLSRIE